MATTTTRVQATLVSIIRGQFQSHVQQAIDTLRDSEAKVDIHGARKQLKRARALIRLLRVALGDNVYRRTNIALRDAARPLSLARDAQVLLETWRHVAKLATRNGKTLKTSKIQASLRREHTQHRAKALSAHGRNEIARALANVHQHSINWRPLRTGWPPIAHSLQRTYKQGRRALTDARDQQTADLFHEWRKQVKYLWHQLQALELMAPKEISALAKELHRLADQLGDDHDLVVLRSKLSTSEDINDGTRAELHHAIDRRRGQLQKKALKLGERLYADKPKQFHMKFAKYWDDWNPPAATLLLKAGSNATPKPSKKSATRSKTAPAHIKTKTHATRKRPRTARKRA